MKETDGRLREYQCLQGQGVIGIYEFKLTHWIDDKRRTGSDWDRFCSDLNSKEITPMC